MVYNDSPTACADSLNTDSSHLVRLSILALINVMVIVGNCLVIAAVYYSSKLRSVTNFFIVSLAVADLMVGVAVLPFSATREVFDVSIFVLYIFLHLRCCLFIGEKITK